eukprot:TRINITY_DN2602_c0_g1_i2.p1 TRINITY_DN2602_c0_g1~~TRINITY_DN2602_c0_g1_i2.p1  ORF type:complete len:210 (-),score=43.86 TRINITY_DN2602_c0_g1_i2:34-663(-)
MTLSRYNEIFENGYGRLSKRGFWRLKSDVQPYKIPIYTMKEKNTGIERCRFCAEHYAAEYKRRKENPQLDEVRPVTPPLKLERKPKFEQIKKEEDFSVVSSPYEMPNFYNNTNQMAVAALRNYNLNSSIPVSSPLSGYSNIQPARVQEDYSAILQSMNMLKNLKSSGSTDNLPKGPPFESDKTKRQSKGSIDFILDSPPENTGPGKRTW